jgi:hypothetical protein
LQINESTINLVARVEPRRDDNLAPPLAIPCPQNTDQTAWQTGGRTVGKTVHHALPAFHYRL